MPNLLNFEWETDRDGYHIETIKWADTNWVRGPGGWSTRERETVEEPRALGQPLEPVLTPSQLSLADMDLSGLKDWPVDPEAKQDFLVPDGQETLRYRPLDKYPALFREFADAKISPEGANAFADKYGLLHTRDDIEPVEYFFDEINRMRSAVEMWESGLERRNWAPLIQAFDRHTRGAASIKFGIASDADRLALHITPNSLISAMWLQFAQAVSVNTQLQRCLWCPTWFVYGTGTGRRKSAHFCSDKCRKAMHRHRKETKK